MKMITAFAKWALARAREPSTYAGLAGFVGALTFLPAADLAIAAKVVAAAAITIPSVIAIVIPEGAKS